jgi:signal transduction histidine kinase
MAHFRTRARAVDMLGRQQIAGIPTAISELFKNAHDAYADRVEVDFFRGRRLFLLRDDGIGMSEDDFLRRWLTLGTESKLGAGGLAPPVPAPGKPPRPILGEKGIGRLAIAAIGPQVLVLSRPIPPASNQLVASFIHWGLFRLPGVNLDEIDLPVLVFPGGTVPTGAEVASMVASLRDNLRTLSVSVANPLIAEIEGELDTFEVDPRRLDALAGGPSLVSGYGTHFYITPTDESLAATIDPPTDDDTVAAPLVKTLIGFSNTMTPNHTPPAIETAFRDHKSADLVDDLIESGEFFTPEEFLHADHHIQGVFDEFGTFRGTVNVYGTPTEGHVVPWRAAGLPTACGPFQLNLAVVQGERTATRMPPDEWAQMVRKLSRIGGLYIYKDGVRVLPYGNNDYDYLDIERNRTKSASYYYFSYRRIFGVIELEGGTNAALTEKAGREGFRENLAYRQFRHILKNFFVQMAADFFREGGVQAATYEEGKAELERVEKARRARERNASERRQRFEQKLESSFYALGQAIAAGEVRRILTTFDGDLAAAEAHASLEEAARAFVQAESRARRELDEVLEQYHVVPPRGVALPKRLRQELEAYRTEFTRFQAEVYDPALVVIEARLGESTRSTRVAIDRRLRFARALDELSTKARKGTEADAHEVRTAASEVQTRAADVAKASLIDVDRVVRDVLDRAGRLDVSRLSDEEFVAQRSGLEREMEAAVTSQHELLAGLASQIRAVITQDTGGATATLEEIAVATEEDLQALRERSEADLELAQLGMAIQVINHEFDATIRDVRRNLRQLGTWADANPALKHLYESITGNFAHLDGYLTMFTPLQRRLYRRAVRITGGDIYKFLTDLFEDRLRRHAVELQATSKFRRRGIVGYPSTLYPVFVNLVDNAIYWTSKSHEPRRIRLDADDRGFLVSDTGPGIAPRDGEVIFEMGFSRRPGGRGLGLHISRQVLAREGFRLELEPTGGDRGAAFRITTDQATPTSEDTERDLLADVGDDTAEESA